MDKFSKRIKNIGPGAMVAAAFIGPGTVTACTRSGAAWGYTLLWAMLFSIIATIVFQEMSSRLGIVTGQGLGENIRQQIKNPFLKAVTIVIVIAAIFIGNCAYETGNITGGMLGLRIMFPSLPVKPVIIAIAVIAALILWSGNNTRISGILTAIVITMSVVFVVTAFASKPDWKAVFHGMFFPSVNSSNLRSAIELIGTTVVPYNLFLHASASAERWKNKSKEDILDARIDSVISIGLGGIISMAIIIAAAENLHGAGITISSGADMALAIEPTIGVWSKWFVALGLFSAGFTSVITASLSTAFAVTGAIGIKATTKNIRFKIVWLFVICVGAVFAILLGKSPTQLILVAQAANAIILPIIAFFVLYCVNSKIMGVHKNGILNNIFGGVIIIICCVLCYRNFTGFLSSLKALIS